MDTREKNKPSDWNNYPKGKELPELRVLLIGKTGQGKSDTGNSILGQSAFDTSGGAASCTKEVITKSANRFGCHIRVTDTPGLFDTDMTTQEAIRHMLLTCLFITLPGLDAILFVLRKGEKFTPELQTTQRLFFEWFGKGVEEYAHLVLTHCNDDDEAQHYLNHRSHNSLIQLVQRCGNRVIPINNGRLRREDQVQYLVKRIKAARKGNRSFKDIKYDVLTHIAMTRDKVDFSPESLTIMEKVIPDINRFLKSEAFPLIQDDSSSQNEFDLPVVIEYSDRMQHNEAVSGNLTILDDSPNQQGLYFPNPSVTSEQSGSCIAVKSSDSYREDSLNDNFDTASLSDESEPGNRADSIHPIIIDDTTVNNNKNVIQDRCTGANATDIGGTMSESDSTFEESNKALGLDDGKLHVRKSSNYGDSPRSLVARLHTDRQHETRYPETCQHSSDTVGDDTNEKVDENIRTFRKIPSERCTWFNDMVRWFKHDMSCSIL